jgi:hypothetical protein
MASLVLARPAVAPVAWPEVLLPRRVKVLKKARIISIAAATLLSSPAFAGWSLAQAAQPIDGERIIREVVINGRLIEGDRDESPTNELRPVPGWVGQSSAVDRRPQPSW